MNPKKAPNKRRKNAGLSLHPEMIALLDKYRGLKSKSVYAEEIINEYFQGKSDKLSAAEKRTLRYRML